MMIKLLTVSLRVVVTQDKVQFSNKNGKIPNGNQKMTEFNFLNGNQKLILKMQEIIQQMVAMNFYLLEKHGSVFLEGLS